MKKEKPMRPFRPMKPIDTNSPLKIQMMQNMQKVIQRGPAKPMRHQPKKRGF